MWVGVPVDSGNGGVVSGGFTGKCLFWFSKWFLLHTFAWPAAGKGERGHASSSDIHVLLLHRALSKFPTFLFSRACTVVRVAALPSRCSSPFLSSCRSGLLYSLARGARCPVGTPLFSLSPRSPSMPTLPSTSHSSARDADAVGPVLQISLYPFGAGRALSQAGGRWLLCWLARGLQ